MNTLAQRESHCALNAGLRSSGTSAITTADIPAYPSRLSRANY